MQPATRVDVLASMVLVLSVLSEAPSWLKWAGVCWAIFMVLLQAYLEARAAYKKERGDAQRS
jgi:hypothetical protein